MSTIETTPDAGATDRPAVVFRRVLVGVDKSPESVEAARQAARLVDAGGAIALLSAWMLPPPVIAPEVAFFENEEVQRRAAREALAAAESAVAAPVSPETKVVRGTPWLELVREIARMKATLVVVGSHGTRRMRGIVLGSTATEIVHRAPCSVLVARAADAAFPRRIVVGVDGSSHSAAAHAAAARLAQRLGAELRPVVARGGTGVDVRQAAAIVDRGAESLPDDPVKALVAASIDADLVVVGSRGLHGLRALGSVSERVAHEARCSTLIVRASAP